MQAPPIWQRLLAAVIYALPWADAVPFGRALFGLFPALQWLTLPALPLALLQNQIPFGGFLLFLVLFLAVVRNPQVPYLIRFNALQAILIDIVLILISLAFNVLLAPLGGGFALRTLSNTIFLGTLVLVLFAVIQCLRGKEADIPSLSEAVRMQLH
ncbi:Tic20 family protein [Synechococcus sp. CCY9202]|uniref:Tic20 family protein n=1 Tax=Synechococcus sp. CCY9202 TaxID=174698 RepID=UPI002B2192AB|nr:Tic20 family protein [Synechococcus sp. CCY9202]MEA5423254.1 Tic20 family protein [Synechococcus sp. CCY9202]